MSSRRKIHSSMLYCFDEVRKQGSIREAAKSLHIASSAVSRHIQKLEDHLGIKLFERSSQGLALTAAGESFARHAQLVLQDTERLLSDINAIQGIQKGHIEIATVEGPAVELIPRAIRLFREDFPKVSIGVKVTGSQDIAEHIMNGDVDIGLAFDLDHTKGLTQLWTSNYKIGAVVTPQHPLAHKQQITFSECADYPVILSQKNLSIYQHLRPLIPLLHSDHEIIETNSVSLARKFVLDEQGIAFQTIIGIESDLASSRLKHIPIKDPKLKDSELGIYIRADRTLPVAAQQFSEVLVKTLSKK